MADELQGKKIAFLVANEGLEQVELTSPWGAVKEAGGQPVLVASKPGRVQGFNHLDRADEFSVDRISSEVSVDEFDALVLPGGVANADQLRADAAGGRARSRILRYGPSRRRHMSWTVGHRGG